jgi:hypothetical protein
MVNAGYCFALEVPPARDSRGPSEPALRVHHVEYSGLMRDEFIVRDRPVRVDLG